MKELIMNAYEDMYEFRDSFIIAVQAIGEKLEKFYDNLGEKMMVDGIKGKIWEAIFMIIAGLNFILALPFIPAAFLIVDLPFNILRWIILLNHWDWDD